MLHSKVPRENKKRLASEEARRAENSVASGRNSTVNHGFLSIYSGKYVSPFDPFIDEILHHSLTCTQKSSTLFREEGSLMLERQR